MKSYKALYLVGAVGATTGILSIVPIPVELKAVIVCVALVTLLLIRIDGKDK